MSMKIAPIAVLAALVLTTAFGGCTKTTSPAAESTTRSGGASSPPPSGSATSAPAQATPAGPVVDLLTAKVGTVLRSWPASDSPPEDIMMGSPGWTAAQGTNGPYEFVYELRTSATIEELKVDLGQVQDSSAQTVHLAVSSTSATSGFKDVGTYQLTGAQGDYPLSPAARARWIKISIGQHGASTTFYDLHVFGRLDARPATAPVAGLWKYYAGDPYPHLGLPRHAAGALPAPTTVAQLAQDDSVLEIRQTDTGLVGATCGKRVPSQAFRGQIVDATVKLAFSAGPLTPAIVNDEGTLLVAFGGQQDWLATRLSGGGSCDTLAGHGPRGSGTPVLVIFDTAPDRYGPYAEPESFPGYRFVPQLVSSFDQTTLGSYHIAVLSWVCNAGSALTKTQTQALVDWVYSGGKLIIQDSDDCTKTDYSFLPYAFTTSNPGAQGAKGGNLVLVESNTLGSRDKNSPDFVDVQGYVADRGQQLGDANVVITQDPHWCGHLYGTNVLNQNGFEQVYAPFGQGLIIYDGLDADDNSIAAHDTIVRLELKQAADATLPCTQMVSPPFTVAPSSAGTFTPGRAQEMGFPLALYASHGYSGTVSLKVVPPPDAPWPTSLSDNVVPVNGGSANINLKVSVPASAKPGSYPFVVTATDAAGHATTATVTLASSGAPAPAPATRATQVPATPKIAPALAKDKRVAVYGIYFDFASATLKPASTPVLEEIAEALKANPDWSLTIEGHTDSVGGAGYNLDLSTRRSAAVEDALVTRYHIAAQRLSTAGYGFTRPKASNDTPEGRALNRRVELVRK
jgi:outer membrane protein OmpA-like peptidoglycan-associated protein